MTRRIVPIFDGHNDALLAAHPARGGRDIVKRGDKGHFDVPRATEGGFVGGLFAIYVPAETKADTFRITTTENGWEVEYALPLSFDYASSFTKETLDLLSDAITRSEGKLRLVTSIDEYEEAQRAEAIAAVLHFEGAEAIDPGLESLDHFYERGLRSLGIVWSRPNAFGFGVPFKFPSPPDTGPGLTPEGIQLVKRCNELGILVDLSHLNEQGFWDVERTSDAPLVASHSAAHALTSTARNLTDKQLDAIKASGGIVGVNFSVSDIRADAKDDTDTPLSDLIRHISYMVERMGVAHVGLGSDFDGAHIPAPVGDASGLQRVVEALEHAGFSSADITKIAHDNWLRVLKTTWR